MAGNLVVLKPVTQGSLCGLYLARIFEKAGVPSGVLNTITGKGSEIGDYITTHKGINFINFTGSTEVGVTISKINREDNLIYPTLFDNVTTDMRLAWEEPFSPVLPIIRVNDKDEAIEIANKSEYGLQSAVFTKNINDAFYVADKLEVGTV